jgi:hypothetical protein
MFRRALAAVLTAAALGVGTSPARADIVPTARLLRIIRANPPLAATANDGRWWVSLAKGGDEAGYLDPTIVDYGYQRDGADVLIVPLPSGGSGGVFTTLIFTRVRTKPAYAGKIESQGHLDVFLAQGVINARTPVYGPHDPQAAPSGHKTVRYRVRGTNLIQVDEFAS